MTYTQVSFLHRISLCGRIYILAQKHTLTMSNKLKKIYVKCFNFKHWKSCAKCASWAQSEQFGESQEEQPCTSSPQSWQTDKLYQGETQSLSTTSNRKIADDDAAVSSKAVILNCYKIYAALKGSKKKRRED